MFFIDQIILLSSALILLGILSSKLSARLGLPMLVLFLIVGMLAGEEGLGRIVFNSPEAAHAVGTLALALILFDGGLQTPMSSIQRVWKPATSLATIGVLFTAALTGAAASMILPITMLEGLLIGAIVGSTDAAAVFSLLRNAGINLNTRVKSTLEVESASNDPMAIFLTIGLLEVIVNQKEMGWNLAQLFFLQMGGGAIAGLAVGYLTVKLVNRINLQATGLYPVLVASCGLLSFGVAAYFGGSGFLAVFICGVMIGNQRFVFQRTTFLFHDGLAWLSQITMFVMLGLLINPHGLLEVWIEGLAIAAVLLFIARPLAVAPLLALFRFNPKEIALMSWVGLRGSVPIILAIFPLLYGLPGAEMIFNAIFFVVLISATLQGSTLPWAAKKLGLIEELPVKAAATLEITAIGEVDAEIVEYTLSDTSRAANRRLARMALPEGVVVAMITRKEQVIPPRGSTVLQAGDHLFVVLKPEFKDMVEQAFADTGFQSESLPKEWRLKGASRLEDIQWCYNLAFAPTAHLELTLEQLAYNHLNGQVEKNAQFVLGDTLFRVDEVVADRAVTVSVIAATCLQDSP